MDPTDVEKERHIQFQMVCTLSNTDLNMKLLAMKIEVTTAEMLAVCHTHIAIADNMSFMDLSTHQSIQGKGKSQTGYEEPQADQLQR